MRTTHWILASIAAAVLAASPVAAEGASSSSPGYVDGSIFRALLSEDDDIVEVNLDKTMLRALGKKKTDEEPGESSAKELFATLDSVHAVVGTVKGPASKALEIIQQTDRKLAAAGWQRVTRIKDETSLISVLTHVTGDQVDGLVALIFDAEDKEIVFANLAGHIDLTKLGEYGDTFNVPGLEHVPGAR